jgi:arylsulfatase A
MHCCAKVIVFAFVTAAVFFAAAWQSAAAAESPNFVVFLADDMGYGDLGCYGHPVMKTPNLDQFAKQGLRLTDCYSACSVCSPSRSAILTGRTPYRNGVFTWIPEGRDVYLRKSEITVASLLKQRGYATCHVGKWHLNGKFNSPEQPQPSDHGYDWWFATQNNAAPSHKNPTNFVRNGQPVGQLEGFSAVLAVEEAIHWLEEHRDSQKPFFLTVWTHEPHLPIESDPNFMALYPDLLESDPEKAQHHGNITQTDFAFGLLMKKLDELKLADDTLVMFTSDNGPEGNGNAGRTRGSTGGLRGRKRAMYEGGIRVPGIVRWPGHVKPGTESDQPVIGSDVFATLCDITGTPLPADRTIDGASLLPMFEGKTIDRKLPLYWRYQGAPGPKIAMRDGDWKLVADVGLKDIELYNLRADRKETMNLAAAEPARLEQLKAKLVKLNAEIEAEGPDWWKTYNEGGGKAKKKQ